MDTKHLITMANRIGDFFVSMPDHQVALNGIAAHIKSFWDPRMRKALRAHIDSTQGAGLNAIVLESLNTRADLWA